MDSSEVMKNIRRIQMISSRMVSGIFAGEYQSVFRGKGMEFEEVREYQPGDDVRCIDWNVTARTGRPFIKQFVEERELTVMFLLDISRSCRFGTVAPLKSRLAAEICALLSFAAIRNNDKVGLILFTDRIEKFIPPMKGNRHVYKIIREALSVQPEGNGTDVALALDYLNRMMKRSAVVFLISDFYAPEFKKPLAAAARRHDLVALSITDPAEGNLPDAGIVKFSDAETGEGFLVDTADAGVRRRYQRSGAGLRDERRKLFRSLGVDHAEITPDVPYLRTLLGFFRMREMRSGRVRRPSGTVT